MKQAKSLLENTIFATFVRYCSVFEEFFECRSNDVHVS